MSTPPTFTIIVPALNRLDLLRETIASIKAQIYRSYELIVVDDGSTDGTTAWLTANEPCIRVISQDHQGPGAARNAGAKYATGTYLAFLDSDDLWFPWTLQTYAQIIAEQQGPAFVAGRQHLFSNAGCLSLVTAQMIEMLSFRDYLATSDAWRWWGASSFVIRREAFLRSGGFNELNVYGEDADLALKLGVEKGFVQVLRPATFAYRQHSANSMSNLTRIVEGAWHMIRSESHGRYPGSRSRSRERQEIITRHIRPTVLACLNTRQWSEAFRLYRSTFWWNLRLLRIRYLIAFPLLMLVAFARSVPSRCD